MNEKASPQGVSANTRRSTRATKMVTVPGMSAAKERETEGGVPSGILMVGPFFTMRP